MALALSDANGGTACKWSTSKTKVHTYNTTSNSNFAIESGLQYNATHNSDTYPAFQAAIANNGTAAPTGCSSWFLASGYQWLEMIGPTGLSNWGLQENANYWLSTEYDAENAWTFGTYSGGCSSGGKGLRPPSPCLPRFLTYLNSHGDWLLRHSPGASMTTRCEITPEADCLPLE